MNKSLRFERGQRSATAALSAILVIVTLSAAGCARRPKYYASSPARNPAGSATGQMPVRRGGSWGVNEKEVRAAARFGGGPPEMTLPILGFRCFRGFAVLVMVLATFLFGTEVLPDWLRHAPDNRLTLPDLGAPLFIVAIGLTFGVSLQRRWARDGPAPAIWHFLRRAILLFAIGLAMAVVWTRLGLNESGVYWGVLQTIALAIALALPFLLLPPLARAAAGLALLAVYQFLVIAHWLNLLLASPHGGLPGCLGWASLLILATACSDPLFRPAGRAWVLPAIGVVAVAGALALSTIVPISKTRVSASYVLLGLGTSVLLLWAFHLLVDRRGIRMPWLAALGKNPLLIYLLQYVLLAPFVLPGVEWWYEQAPVWLTVVEAGAFVGAVIALARFVERRNWILSL